MPPKKKGEKAPSKKVVEEVKAVDEEIDLGDQLRAQGIVVTYSQDSNKISHRNVRDISVSNITMTYQGSPLIEDAELTLNYGNRYGYLSPYRDSHALQLWFCWSQWLW